MKKPVIGIVPLVDAGRESLWMLPGYMEAVAQAGGIPVMLPLTDDGADLEALLALCGGVLLTGGQDVSPEVYGQTALPACGELCPARDRRERAARGGSGAGEGNFGDLPGDAASQRRPGRDAVPGPPHPAPLRLRSPHGRAL